ncbi:DNA adenine methylase [Rhodoferax fermentans]|uniref:site-specific DNA-methyltransferase (adenine-specific) n=1 Tax=Rhodoferax fermentans TaxID=28066 RepID=A0A1T1APE2_RHOFE|nr:DNA adenine methylase [Rhodoferax fermentans]MBK1683378.1 restriction endonuclease subunit M [Rhodoferax fermentans]OOV05873.1 restriction endonuclease subunit M [Rhodoferax fermentans]
MIQAAPMVQWVGGKRRLAPHILPVFPEHTCYVEPFCGAAALFFLKAPVKVEVLNDVNGELVTLYRVVQHHLEEFVRHFKWALASREIYKWLQITPSETLTDIQRAARFFYLQKLGFGGKVTGQTFGTATVRPAGLNLLRLEEQLSAVHLRLHQVFIERLEWSACVERYDRPHSLFYLDPPYFGTVGYGVPFGLEQYDQMAQLMGSMKGKAVVSVNDIPEMRLAFKGHHFKQVSISYTVGASGRGRVPKGELIISNFNPGV